MIGLVEAKIQVKILPTFGIRNTVVAKRARGTTIAKNMLNWAVLTMVEIRAEMMTMGSAKRRENMTKTVVDVY
jgi:hypothetical protein